MLLNLVDDLRVLEYGAIVTEVDGGGLVGELLHAAAGVVVAFLEVREGRGGGAAEGELRGESAPVEFGCCAGLGEKRGG